MSTFTFSENRRLGVLVPASDVAVEVDFRNYLPPDVDFFTARLNQSSDSGIGTDANYQGLIDSAPDAANSVSLVDPELIAFCCTSASFYKGHSWHWELGELISARVGIPTVTTSAAALTALKTLSVSSVLLASPYPDTVNSIEAEWLRAYGIEVVSVLNFGCTQSRDVAKVRPDFMLETFEKDVPGSDDFEAIFITCTGLRSMQIAARLERIYDRPVVTSNSAMIWFVLSKMGVAASQVTAGRLFAHTPIDIPRLSPTTS